MNDLESMLRASLQERAEDVEPTPELWRSVQRKVARRRAVPLLVWTTAGAAAVVTAAVVGPALLDGATDRFTIEPGESITATEGTDADPAPGVAAPLSHYVAVVEGRLVLRGLDGSESVLWDGESQVRTVAVRPGSTPAAGAAVFVTEAEGMYDLRLVRWDGDRELTVVAGNLTPALSSLETPAPTPTWSPDGATIAWAAPTDGELPSLQLVDLEAHLAGVDPSTGLSSTTPVAVPLGDRDGTQLRLQDWTSAGGDDALSFTSLGELSRAGIERVEDGWAVEPLERADGDDYVVDIATASDGTQYRLSAGVVPGAGGAEDAGLALEFDNERVPLPELATAAPADVWMTAVDGGAIVGLGDQAILVLRDPEGDSEKRPLDAVSYAAWVGGGAAATPVPGPTAPTEDAADGEPPAAAGPLDESGVTPYVAIDERGRVAVHTGMGQEREVILDERLWAVEAAVSVQDVTVRPGSSAGEVSGVALLATEAGPELAWFRAAAGATATHRMEGASGLGNGDTAQRDAPAWSPDGRHIAWVEPDGNGAWMLRTVGMAENGPTGADAGFGLDVPGEWLRVAAWTWDEGDGANGPARGSILLVGSGAGVYRVPIERQGDGALAVSEPEVLTSDVEDATLVDAGVRGGELVSLWSVDGELRVRQGATGADVVVPLVFDDPLELDLDVLEHVVLVTRRSTGEAFVVDRTGGVAPLEADAATTHGFDPVR